MMYVLNKHDSFDGCIFPYSNCCEVMILLEVKERWKNKCLHQHININKNTCVTMLQYVPSLGETWTLRGV